MRCLGNRFQKKWKERERKKNLFFHTFPPFSPFLFFVPLAVFALICFLTEIWVGFDKKKCFADFDESTAVVIAGSPIGKIKKKKKEQVDF